MKRYQYLVGTVVFLSLSFWWSRPVAAKVTNVSCVMVSDRIDASLTRFESHKVNHLQHYQNLKEKLQNLITSLEANGDEVTVLKSHHQVLDNRIVKFTSDYATWIAQLELAKTYSCSPQPGRFKTALEQSRIYAKVVQADALELRNYYQLQIRPTILAVKAQRPDQKN